MRTKNLMMVLTALAMAGCSQNEVTDMNPDAHRAIDCRLSSHKKHSLTVGFL